MTDPVRGAYGLRLPGLAAADHLLPKAPSAWVDWSHGHRPPAAGEGTIEQVLSQTEARLLLRGGGWIEIDRERSSSTVVLAQEPSVEAMVHPYLGLPASVNAHWRGWHAFHAGGATVDERVWGVLGDKELGKSSLLAWCSQQPGAAVSSDDLLIVDDEHRVLAGPRCIDLRPDSADQLGLGELLGSVGGRPRWRMQLPDTPTAAPLAGWVELAWGADVEVKPLDPSESFPAIVRALSLRVLPRDSAALLGLVDLPAFRFTRPRDYARSAEANAQLLEALRSAPV